MVNIYGLIHDAKSNHVLQLLPLALLIITSAAAVVIVGKSIQRRWLTAVSSH